MKAAPEHQKKLLELQQLDTRLARLAHERRTLPALKLLAEQHAEQDALFRRRALAEAELTKEQGELVRIEELADKIAARVARHKERQQAGGSAKQAQAIEAELATLAEQAERVDEEQLIQMERVEELQAQLAEVAREEELLAARRQAAEQERDTEFARLDAQRTALTGERADLAATIDANLLDLYEDVRASTGGLGAVALHDTRTDGVSIDFSLTELDAIRAAAPDEVVQSEDYGYILVRL